MLLVVAATKKEIKPIEQSLLSHEGFDILVTGMGPVAAAAILSRHLALHGSGIRGVINIGVGGAYAESGLDLLDLCLARRESFGDFGICLQDGILDFDSGLSELSTPLLLDNEMVHSCKKILAGRGVQFKEADFVTVNCCTGTGKRGAYLKDKFKAGCENMEGAAVAMVCSSHEIPCAEMRCISNMVTDRNTAEWKLDEAIEKLCEVTELLLQEYGHI